MPEAAAALGGINVLVNNASGFGRGDDEESWAASVSVDLMAIVRATASALPFLEHASDGAIVNVSSISALRATKRNPSYGAVKAAVDHYTGSQARMLAGRGLRVNAVAPGSIEFPGGSWERRRTEDKELYDGDAGANSVRAAGHTGGGGGGDRVPGVAAGTVDHRAEHRRRRRAAAGAVRPLTSRSTGRTGAARP